MRVIACSLTAKAALVCFGAFKRALGTHRATGYARGAAAWLWPSYARVCICVCCARSQQVSPAFVLHNYLPKDMTMYRGVPSSVLLAWELEATTGPTAAPVPSTPKTAKAAKGGGGHTSLGQQQKRVGEKRVREDGDLDEGELVDADVAQRQQQRGAGGVGGQGRQAGTSAAGGPPGPSEAGMYRCDYICHCSIVH